VTEKMVFDELKTALFQRTASVGPEEQKRGSRANRINYNESWGGKKLRAAEVIVRRKLRSRRREKRESHH